MTRPSRQTRNDRNLKRGECPPYLKGHNLNNRRRPAHRRLNADGYVLLYRPEHPQAYDNGFILEHALVVSQARKGRPLPPQAEIHHWNQDKTDNRGANLIVCENRAYHGLLHQRQRAWEATGHADWRQCYHCHLWGDPTAPDFRMVGKKAVHRECQNAYCRLRRPFWKQSQ